MNLSHYIRQHKSQLGQVHSERGFADLFGEKYGQQHLDDIRQQPKIKIVARDITSAFEMASKQMQVEVSQLDYEVLQTGKTFLGFTTRPYTLLFSAKQQQRQDEAPVQKVVYDEEDEFEFEGRTIDGWVEAYISREGKFVAVHSPRKDGKKATQKDMKQALENILVSDLDESFCKGMLKKASGKPFKVGEWIPDPLRDGKVFVEVSGDKMKGFVRLGSPKQGGRNPDKQDVLEALRGRHIIYGVDQDAVEAATSSRRQNIPHLVAKGKPMSPGKDAGLEPKVDLEGINALSEYSEQDKIDFRQISTIVSVVKDQVIIAKNPASQGEDGVNIYGELIPASEGKDASIPKGKNTHLTDDGLQLKAAINGHLVKVGDVVHVREVYVVRGDVGTQTGHVTSLSSIVIWGSVLDGYNVKSGGHIEIKKNVGHCSVEAIGDIVVKMGVNGHHKGNLTSEKGSVYAKYLQDCSVKAKENIFVSESVLNCKLNADNAIRVMGKKGAIMGGLVRALRSVTCKNLGSPSGVKTRVEVGVLPDVRAAMATYMNRIETFEDKIEGLNHQLSVLRGTADSPQTDEEKAKDIEDKLEFLKEQHSKDLEKSSQLKEFIRDSYQNVQGEVVAIKSVASGVFVYCNAGTLENTREQGPSHFYQETDNLEYVRMESLSAREVKKYVD